MTSGWRYRVAGVCGTAALVTLAVVLANHSLVQSLLALLPVIGDLALEPAAGAELAFEAGTAAAVLLAALVPLFKPRPRRILDTASLAAERTLLAAARSGSVSHPSTSVIAAQLTTASGSLAPTTSVTRPGSVISRRTRSSPILGSVR